VQGKKVRRNEGTQERQGTSRNVQERTEKDGKKKGKGKEKEGGGKAREKEVKGTETN
jgi:hypothetical protein